MSRTVRGKILDSIFTSVPLDKVKTYESARNFFNHMVGESYEVSYDLDTLTMMDVQYVIVKARVSLVEDSGNKISREYIVSNEVSLGDDGKPLNLSMTIDKAEKEAFRRCVCTNFFKVESTSATTSAVKSSESSGTIEGRNSQTNQASMKPKKDEKNTRYMVKLVSPLESLPLANYRDSYRCRGVCDGEEVQLVFWFNTTKKLRDAGLMDRLENECRQGGTIQVDADKGIYKKLIQLSVSNVYF